MHHRATRRQLLAAFPLIALLVLTGPASAKNANPGVIPPQADAFGQSYEDWAASWWQWVFSLPGAHHPLFDQTGADCAKGQKGKVWFLAGLFTKAGDTTGPGAVTRHCTIPNGKAIFFPVLNGWADYVGEEIPPTNQKQTLIDRCEGNLTGAKLAVTLDGEAVKNLQGYLIDPTFFTYTMPEHGFFEVAFDFPFVGSPPPPGAVTCGYYLLLTPLSKGSHDLHIETSNANGFVQDVTYHLTITK